MLKIIYDKLSQTENIGRLLTNKNPIQIPFNTIRFINGVYDLEKAMFNNYNLNDHTGPCINYNHIPYNKTNEINKEIKCFLTKIQPRREMRQYLTMILSMSVAQSFINDILFIFTGTILDGNSNLIELLKITFGDYLITIDADILINNDLLDFFLESSNFMNARICIFDGTKATENINLKFIEIFGSDSVHKTIFSNKKIPVPILLCHHLPRIRYDKDDIWKKLKIILFLPSEIIKPTELTKKNKKNDLFSNHFLEDDDILEKLPKWKEMFMAKLINYYKKYRTNGLIHPKLVTKYTQDWHKECDVFQNFIGDYLEKTAGNTKNSLSIMTLHKGMKCWYKATHDGKCPNIEELRDYMLHRMTSLFNSKTDSLIGYKLKINYYDGILDELTNLHE